MGVGVALFCVILVFCFGLQSCGLFWGIKKSVLVSNFKVNKSKDITLFIYWSICTSWKSTTVKYSSSSRVDFVLAKPRHAVGGPLPTARWQTFAVSPYSDRVIACINYVFTWSISSKTFVLAWYPGTNIAELCYHLNQTLLHEIYIRIQTSPTISPYRTAVATQQL